MTEYKPVTRKLCKPCRLLYNQYVLTEAYTHQLTPLSPRAMRKRLLDKHCPAYAIVHEGRFAGFYQVQPFRSQEGARATGEITLYLAPGACGKGLGKQALTHLEESAKKAGYHTLIAVLDGENARSEALFTRADYVLCGRLQEVGFKFGRYHDTLYYQKLL